jgi:methionyl-tRNA formyltransferase
MKEKPLFAFFGTPHIGVYVLDALEAHGLMPALVVTAPDKKRGRGLELQPSPVKVWATERGIDVLTPENLKDEQLAAELRNSDWDLFVVAAYGKLIPKNILDIPRKGCLNLHPSLLPKLRGPSPIYSAILEDTRETGVSIMLMTEKMDAGPVLAQARVEIAPEDWPLKGSVLLELLGNEGGNLLAETIPSWLAGQITPEAQDEAAATYTKKFTDEDTRIELAGDAMKNLLRTRAFDSKHYDSSHRAYFMTPQGKRVIVTEGAIEDAKFVVKRVIPEGKKEMDYEDFLKGQK